MIKSLIEELLVQEIGKFGVEAAGVVVSRSTDPKFGDFSTNAAMKISRDLKQSPMETAKILADRVESQPQFEKVEVVAPGFVNFFVKADLWQSEIENVLGQGQKYGSNESGKGKKARVEYVSANPTGPLHFGNARGGPIGDVLANILAFSGWEVLREYLHNDIGGQVVKLGQTIENVAKGQNLEEQEYKGEYIKEIVEKIGDFETPEQAGKMAVDMMLDETLADCAAMGIKFDKVYSESGFVESKDTEKALEELEKKGVLKEKDGAKWFAPSDEFLKDRETVVVKSDGTYTYFSNDIAYHRLKFAEGYDLVVDVFGANHHGHVPRLQAVVSSFGFDVSKFHVILYQWVRFKKGGEILAMSKRSGNFVTAREVLEMVGADAVRFFVLMHDANSHIDFDLDLAREQSNRNPVYYVQYAHARICSILAKSKVKSQNSKVKLDLLKTPFDIELIKKITQLPEVVEEVAGNFAVNRITTYATDLADTFHKFYENCRVIDEENEDLTEARLALVNATKTALQNTLKLLGISAPEKM